MKIEPWQLKQRQGLPLDIKEGLTANRIRAWYEYWHGKVHISLSGGKDSTVLLHQVRRMYPKVTAVFSDTGLEYPEIRNFVKTIENVDWVKPNMSFKEVIEKYGYPVISKDQAVAISRYRNTKDPVQKYRRLNGWPRGKKGMISHKWRFLIDAPFKISEECCTHIKKKPLDGYAKEKGTKPFIGTMAEESHQRKRQFYINGCNAFESKKPKSLPISFWLEKDIWDYIKKYNVSYSKIYDMGESRTGCMFCMFGVHFEKGENRFQRMAKSHPKQYDYCINKLGLGEVLDFIGVEYKPQPQQTNLF
jgi:3'-phosphoadenosine 5'-phosphosulfate sulfotransferase (PAPS reductase)/FAD synthetase